MKPTMEKMTKPANMLVKELMQQTIIESLWIIRKEEGFTTAEWSIDSLGANSGRHMVWLIVQIVETAYV